MLKIYNSLTGKKSVFTPLKTGKIGIYVCGNTVYDYAHIGHARSMILFDVIVNFLRSEGHDVTFVRNITDIDDKIIKRALENNESIEALTQRFITAQHEDEQALGLNPPDYEPRATQYIPQMIALIEKLIATGHAYVAASGEEQGDVLFNVKSFSRYGELSGNTVEKLLSGLKSSQKTQPLDFALWKLSKPGEPHWSSPWGEGRPGWHIECSAMSTEILGQPFDIHGGGMDLKFPHHENEIAQSEAGCHQHFAEWWMHVGLLLVNGEKMSKSLHNFVTVREALAKYHPEELRFFMLNSHYTSPADFSEKNMAETKRRLFRFYNSLQQLPETEEVNTQYWERFREVMLDDFNTALALTVMSDCISQINQTIAQKQNFEAALFGNTARKMAKILGILQDPNYLKGNFTETEMIENLLDEREKFRAQKQWAKADEIRKKLSDMGIAIEDSATGARWRKET